MPGLSLRAVQKKIDCCTWVTCRMSELRDGDLFRVFDRMDGGELKPVISNGVSEWTVQGAPTKREDGIWQVAVRGDG